MRDVIGHLIESLERGSEVIVCQVVETRGSTPQKAGSMMIVDPDGGQGGTLGGGCVENEVKTKALQQLSSGDGGRSFFRVGSRLRLGRRADLRWADGGDRSPGARARSHWTISAAVRPIPRRWPRLHRGRDAGPGSAESEPPGRRISVRRLRECAGQSAGGGRSRRAFLTHRQSGQPAQAIGPRRSRVPAELAADPADRRRGGTCRPGGCRPRCPG